MSIYIRWIMIVMFIVGFIMCLFDVEGIMNNHLRSSSKIGGLLIGGAFLIAIILGYFEFVTTV